MKYSDLVVWQKAMDLVTSIYKITAVFPNDERFGLTSQIRRAAVSVPSNIAEGHGRKATGAYLNHISIALGSVMELETQLQIALRLNFVDSDTCIVLLSQTDEIGRMLGGLKKSIANQVE
ncbi:four helix bundle protein [Sideroxydans lithotrophicus]|uniref:S23 ribosomal protein n=1 Tax=Sideroxydans lithotrophicus (strain ES-1) TaxID=580332 RepID=D5CN49_SIDLE|nr:four helix bundle protein [Sideroxydans lithotrophicus]ADE12746.1 S23 ribosomal protein [Sideroxydans lithotrophicus ES-1]